MEKILQFLEPSQMGELRETVDIIYETDNTTGWILSSSKSPHPPNLDLEMLSPRCEAVRVRFPIILWGWISTCSYLVKPERLVGYVVVQVPRWTKRREGNTVDLQTTIKSPKMWCEDSWMPDGGMRREGIKTVAVRISHPERFRLLRLRPS